MINDPRISSEENAQKGFLQQVRSLYVRLNNGSFTVIVGLVIIAIIFQIANQHFLTPLNLMNLMLQIAGQGVMSIGMVLILLLGEIDLSAGAVSGLCAAIMAVLNVKMGVPGLVAVLAGLLSGALVGLFQGLWITRLRVPSFIVTLAGFIGWQGVLLYVLGNTGTVNLRNPFILSLMGNFYSKAVGWAVAIFFVLVYSAIVIFQRQRRVSEGLGGTPLGGLVMRIVLVTIGVLGSIAIFNADRGLSSAVVLFIGLIILFDVIVQRTQFGRHVFAVGGNAEAARRASIPVGTIRVAVFTLGSFLAAAGGIMRASRLLAVNQSSGSGDLLLNVIAAAVIGGTSLFGGRGTVWAALLGTLVIGSISNGMDLLALASPIKFMVTGAVLIVAVTLDSLARRQREASGR
jgi:D-xylose transport system permease protein